MYLSFLAVIVGGAGALTAVALTEMIGLFTNLFIYHRVSFQFVKAYPNQLGWGIIVVPVIGGLLIGLMARFGSDKIRGHGIPEAMEAILIGKSVIAPKVAVLKPVSAAISIGSGGPFGAEGPIIMTGGSIGSVMGQFLYLSAAERKILLLAGAAAGMCATFNAPIASVLFVTELLAFEMRPRSVMPIALASGSADFIRIGILGGGAIFPSAAQPLLNAQGMAVGLLFGIVGPAIAYLLTKLIYKSEDWFAKLPLHWMYWPAIGGLAVGLGGFVVPQVLGVGYDTIQGLAIGHVALALALKILIVKTIVWVVALGSGTSGGILAPVLIIGGTLGEAMGILFHAPDPAVWSILGMAAVFAGVTRSPFTAILFLLELTHDMQMLLPLTIACMLAYGVSALALSRSILTEKIARRNRLITRDYSIDPLALYTLAELALEPPVLVSEKMTFSELIRRQAGEAAPADGFLVVSAEDRLIGYIKQAELWKWVYSGRAPYARLGNHCAGSLTTIASRQTASEALTMLLAVPEQLLAVVDEEHRPKGIVTASMLLGIRDRTADEEYIRERYLTLSWMRRLVGWRKLAIHSTREAEREGE
ncbi:chloride channel protein [Paenibacillus sp. UNC496MF]|uniref:chloride channel protein n=1 Tax=Paenibacillus sp. UNC496MF TaxID=1502753 RepID=UPI001C4306F7|nr:chloride channel protein [Paenibacillus sp. UNC496MF]